MILCMAAKLVALVLILATCACSVGFELTNAPYPKECIPGSATRPC